jgi:uncharacterized protein YbaP (TraB family)
LALSPSPHIIFIESIRDILNRIKPYRIEGSRCCLPCRTFRFPAEIQPGRDVYFTISSKGVRKKIPGLEDMQTGLEALSVLNRWQECEKNMKEGL